MSPKERAVWTVEALHQWARDLFATRDEAAKVARDEAMEQREALRREAVGQMKRIDERLDAVEEDMRQRLADERSFREKVVEEALTRGDYQREHRTLQDKLDAQVDQLDKRITRNENTLANLQGRAIVVAVLGSIFLATVTAFITHLLS